MNDHDVFWELEGLSDGQLLERLGSVLGSSRRLMAELIAHLGEVEDRRLHLAAAGSSMFAYCLKLGMTEDEAYRRIEVARLARRYAAIFPLIANGQLTISTVALLKHHLSEENHLELLAAMEGRTVVQARELIAARFPRPDVPSRREEASRAAGGAAAVVLHGAPDGPVQWWDGAEHRRNGAEHRRNGDERRGGRCRAPGRRRASAGRRRPVPTAKCQPAPRPASSPSPPNVTRSNSQPAPSSRASSGSPET